MYTYITDINHIVLNHLPKENKNCITVKKYMHSTFQTKFITHKEIRFIYCLFLRF